MQSLSDWLAIGAFVISTVALLFGGGILLSLFQRKPIISIGNATIELRDMASMFYFDVENRGKVEANNFLLQVRMKGKDLPSFNPFQSISYVQPHQLIPFNSEQVLFAHIMKGGDTVVINAGQVPYALPLGKSYRFQVQYTYSGGGAQPSRREIVINSELQNLSFRIEKESN